MKKYNGQIDPTSLFQSFEGHGDVKIFNYALTATQVKGLYTNGAVNFAPATGAQ